MKNIFALLIIFLMFSSCTKLEELNVNVKDPTNVPGESLFTGAQTYLADQMITPNVNSNIYRMFVQQWTETTYIDEANYDIVTRPIPGNFWNTMYRDVLMNLKQSAAKLAADGNLVGDDPAILKNKLAIVEITTVYTYAVLVENFGNIPYSQALSAAYITPAYDDGLSVYKDLIAHLTVALGKIDRNFGSFGDADNMYYGDTDGWFKFGNSLRLRMGMLLSDVDPALAKSTVEAAAAQDLILDNSDNAAITFMPDQPNNNPVNENLVLSGRNDFVAANTLVDMMNSLNDPRRETYFTLVSDTAYIGGIYGASNDFTQYSHVNPTLTEATFEGMFFDAATVEFLLAEGIERGFGISGTAEDHYNNAIRASFAYWGANDVDTYLAQPSVAYATAIGSWKQKIGEQKWIAQYNSGFDSWTAYRMLDFPVLVAPPDAESVLPLRLTYPVSEQTLNGANRAAAATAIGGDAVGTKLFWDKN